MAVHSDLTFITNENGQNLLERFKVLIKDTECFDVLVGYFYTSGFHALYQAPEKNKQAFTFATTKEDVELKTGKPNPLKVLVLLQNNVPDEFLEGHIAESAAHTSGPREVILSEYLIGGAEQ